MGEFSKIERSFWETDEAREMTPEEKYFWLYLRTNANVNTLGCYPFRMRKAMDETGYNRETLEKLLKRMEECGYIFYCAETGEVLLLGWGAQNWTKKTSVLRAIQADLQKVKSEAFKEKLAALLRADGFLPETGEGAPCGQPSQGECLAAPDSNEGHAETPKNIGEQPGTNGAEKEREKEKKEKTFSANSPEFAAFWAAYPNRKNKQTAVKTWNKLKITPEKYRAIMDGLERAKASVEWAKNGGDFIPHPATWLNAGGWENEYKALRPPASQTPENDCQTEARRTDSPLERRRRLAGASALAEGSE